MNFLVILICLTINYVWLKDADRFSDSWFFKFQDQMHTLTAASAQKLATGWWTPLLLIYSIPLLAIWAMLLVTDALFFGVLVMFLHIIVLLIAFDRTQPGKLANDFLDLWKQGDTSACIAYLEKEMATDTVDLAKDDHDHLARFFGMQMTYRCFEKMFVTFFWYMATGPLGIVFTYITYQLRDSHNENVPVAAKQFNRVLVRVLEWGPLRLLALSFSLAGNFVKSFGRLKEVMWDFSLDANYAELLFDFAGLALFESDQLPVIDNGSEMPVERAKIAASIEALQALLERSQLIWLSVLALITVFGIN